MKKLLLVFSISIFMAMAFSQGHNYVYMLLENKDGSLANFTVRNLKDKQIVDLFNSIGMDPKKVNLNDFLGKIEEFNYKINNSSITTYGIMVILEKEETK